MTVEIYPASTDYIESMLEAKRLLKKEMEDNVEPE